MEVVRRPRGRCLRRRLLLQERREHTTTSPGVVPQDNLFHHSQWNLGTGEIIQCVNTTFWPLPRQWYLLATKTGCVFKTRFCNSSNFTWIASVATTVTRHAKRLEAEIENLSIVQQHEHIAGVVFLQNCSAAQPAQSWSDIIQHSLRPQPSFVRFLDLQRRSTFPSGYRFAHEMSRSLRQCILISALTGTTPAIFTAFASWSIARADASNILRQNRQLADDRTNLPKTSMQNCVNRSKSTRTSKNGFALRTTSAANLG